MRILVLGGGAVGSVIAGYLARAGRDITVADSWFPHVAKIRRDGLTVQGVEDEFTVPVPAIHFDALGQFGQADVILIAGKSYDTRLLSLLAREHLGPRSLVVSAQNGMNDSAVGSIVGEERMIAGVVALGADLFSPGMVRRSSSMQVPSIVFGHLGAGGDRRVVERLEEEFEPLGGVKAVDDARPERWGKLALNSMSNALAGLTGLWSDRMWSEPVTLDVIIALGHETASLAAASGVAAVPVLGRIPASLLIASERIGDSAWAQVADHMRALSAERVGRRANRASLLQDIMKGRRTEIDYLNGWIVRRGAELGVPTPTHAQIVAELRTVEAGERPPALDNALPLVEAVHDRYRPV